MTRFSRSLSLLLAATLGAGLAGCSRDTEVLAFVGEFDSFSAELVKKVKSAANPSAGVDAAQKYLDENKARIKAKLEAVKTIRGFQISDDTKKKVEASFMNNATAVAGLELDYVAQAALDSGFRSKLEKLVNDYKNIVAQ